MKCRVRVLPLADRDLDDTSDFLARDSLEAALRFLDAAHQTFRDLSEMPEMGKLRSVDHPRLSGLRQWPVKGFERHLIFYRLRENVMEVL